jgi:uncharacterized protein (TIGR02145 family)
MKTTINQKIKTWFYLILSFGLILSFTTGCEEKNEDPETVIDYDGNVYHVVKIGDQDWLVENLKVTHYRNGDAVPNVTGDAAWEGLAELEKGAYCDYGNNPANGNIYGRLYNFYAVRDSRGLAPAGWHVATDAEWTTMTTFLGGEGVAGGKLKETGLTHWMTPNTDATNSSGFTALPGGFRWFSGVYEYNGLGGVWWTSTAGTDIDGTTRYLDYQAPDCMRDLNNMRHGASVRCVRD